MAFEVFDDVAFYWFLLAALIGFVVPMTYSFCSVLKFGTKANWTHGMNSCKEKNDRIAATLRRETSAKIFGWRGIGFVGGWVALTFLFFSFAAMQGEEMFSFNPYKILGVEEGSTPGEIKKAYRKLSLKYHPDKNTGDGAAAAADMFIKVAKAHEVLTDEATRKNYEMYGNPDGYHGTSVTIGLPSWLTNKENELPILVAYFVIIIVIIPVVVGLWWRNSSKFLEDGVMQNTAYRFYKQVQENTATKYIPGILSSACELSEGAGCKNSQADDLSKLHKKVSENFVKNQGDVNNDIMKVKTLLYAHLLRVPIPASLKPDMEYILERSHHLLNGLLNICMEQRFVTSTMNVIECSQLLTQAMWFHSNNLLQLPHFDQQCIKQLNRAGSAGKTAAGSIDKVKELGADKRRELLKDLTEGQHVDIDRFLDNFPEIEITYDAHVEDEEDVQAGDARDLVVHLNSSHFIFSCPTSSCPILCPLVSSCLIWSSLI
jgi:translocation protein SEC63